MKNLLTILCVLAAYCLFAQDYKLVYYKGDVTIAGQKLAANALIKNDAVVTIGNNTEAIFTNNNKEVVHLNKPGGYTVRNFAAYIKPKSSLSGYYLNYVVNAATHHEADPEKHVTENLKNVGGVSRGHTHFLNFPIVKTNVLDSIVTIRWNGSEAGIYNWILMEHTAGNSQTSVAEGKGTAQGVILYLNELKLQQGKTYSLIVSDETSPAGGTATFYWADATEVGALQNQAMKFEAETNGLSSTLKGAMAAAFLEDKGYYLLANDAYNDVMQTNRENELLKQLYATFRKNIYGE
jgi:hypothetical protein